MTTSRWAQSTEGFATQDAQQNAPFHHKLPSRYRTLYRVSPRQLLQKANTLNYDQIPWRHEILTLAEDRFLDQSPDQNIGIVNFESETTFGPWGSNNPISGSNFNTMQLIDANKKSYHWWLLRTPPMGASRPTSMDTSHMVYTICFCQWWSLYWVAGAQRRLCAHFRFTIGRTARGGGRDLSTHLL